MEGLQSLSYKQIVTWLHLKLNHKKVKIFERKSEQIKTPKIQLKGSDTKKNLYNTRPDQTPFHQSKDPMKETTQDRNRQSKTANLKKFNRIQRNTYYNTSIDHISSHEIEKTENLNIHVYKFQ